METTAEASTSHRGSFAQGMTFGALSFVSLLVLGLGSSIAIARIYGITRLGQFALASAPSLALTYLSTMGEQAALVRELAVLQPRIPRVTGLFAAVMTFSTGLTVLVGALMSVAVFFVLHGPVHQPGLFLPAGALLAGYVAVTNVCWNLDMVFGAFRAGRALFWVRLTQALGYLVIAVTLGFIGPSIWGLVIATVGSWAISLVHRAIAVRGLMRLRVSRRDLRLGFATLPQLVRWGIRVVPASLADGVSTQLATWLLAAFKGVVIVGAYNRAWTLASRLLDVNYRVNEMLFPTLVQRHQAGDAHGFDGAFVDSVRYAVVALLLPAAAGGGAAIGIMGLFGPGFDRGAGAFAILVAVPVLTVASHIQGQVLVAVGRPGVASVVATCASIFTAAATVLLIGPLGATGAALGLLLGYLLDVVVSLVLTRRHLSSPWRQWWPLHQMLALAMAYGAGFASARVISGGLGGIVGVGAGLTAGCCAYVIVFVCAGGVGPRDRARLTRLKHSVINRRSSSGTPTPAVPNVS